MAPQWHISWQGEKYCSLDDVWGQFSRIMGWLMELVGPTSSLSVAFCPVCYKKKNKNVSWILTEDHNRKLPQSRMFACVSCSCDRNSCCNCQLMVNMKAVSQFQSLLTLKCAFKGRLLYNAAWRIVPIHWRSKDTPNAHFFWSIWSVHCKNTSHTFVSQNALCYAAEASF